VFEADGVDAAVVAFNPLLVTIGVVEPLPFAAGGVVVAAVVELTKGWAVPIVAKVETAASDVVLMNTVVVEMPIVV